MSTAAPKTGRVCSVEGCDRPHRAKGLCFNHYIISRQRVSSLGPRPAQETSELPTDIQMKVFLFIYEHTRSRGYQPSFREVKDHFGWSGLNSVTGHILALHRRGWIDHVARGSGSGGSRSLQFLRTPSGAPFTGFVDKEDA